MSGISLMLFELGAFCISASLSKIAIVKAPAGITGVSVAWFVCFRLSAKSDTTRGR